MHHCASHESMHLPYPGILTKVFASFKLISDSDEVEYLSDLFDSRTLSTNHLSVNEFDQLVSVISPSETSLPESPTYQPSFDDTRSNPLANLSTQVEANTKSLETLQSKMVSFESSLASLSKSVELMHSKLDVLHINDRSIARRMDFEFGSLQEGMTHTAKAWEKEFIKLFYRLGTETQFLSKQITSLGGKYTIPWHEKQNWIGDYTLQEITAPLPLPAIPPPAAFGLTKEAYMEKLFAWMTARDGKKPPLDFFDRSFSSYGEPSKFPESSKGKGPVNIPDDD